MYFRNTLALLSAACSLSVITTCNGADYGADVSFPMHHKETIEPNPLGEKREWYKDLINGCVEHYGEKGSRCLSNEIERIEMSLRQPQSMRNYTKNGFVKIRAPDAVFKLLQEFWELNKDKTRNEDWPVGNTYTNHWDVPTKMISVEDKANKKGGSVLKQMIWNAARDTIQEWTGQNLAECSLYGIRVYEEGAVLAPHVDRLPLVSSAIINVDQDLDEPWPLEVIGHDGKAHNVTMLPGDLVLYESHSIIHGRPFPMKGRFMANVFIHFEPTGPVGGESEFTGDLPPYLVAGSPDESNWRMRNPGGHKVMNTQKFATGSTEAHKAAMEANLNELKEYVDIHEDVVHHRDANGWTPLHEGARSGDVEIVKYLVEKGSDVNARTEKKETGGSVLYWAIQTHGEDHPMIQFLKSLGAKAIAPGTKTEL